MYIYTIGELTGGKGLVRGLLGTGDTVTITLYDSTGSLVPLTSNACTEIGVTGLFVFDLENIITKPTVLENYQYIMDNGTGTKQYDEVRAGGWPDAVAPTGSEQLTITVEDGGANPITDVDVQILNSLDTIVLGTGRTDGNGEYSRNIDQGDYKVRLNKNQYDFTVPEDLTVGVGPVAQTYVGSALTQAVPVSPVICRVFGFSVTQDGGSVPTEFDGTAEIISLPHTDSSTFYPGQKVKGQYDKANSGNFYWELPQGASVTVKVNSMGVNTTFVVPNEATRALNTLL
jgi:hypothetical protein